ncbi:hypothetical protein GOODEAATRI_009421, partial [Goodea atripinnis]
GWWRLWRHCPVLSWHLTASLTPSPTTAAVYLEVSPGPILKSIPVSTQLFR